MDSVKKYLKLFVSVLKRAMDPIFIIFVMIAFGLWDFNKLGNNYDTNIIIPVKIENNVNRTMGILADTYDVECRVNGEGYKLIKYKLHPETNTEYVDISRLDITPVENSVESEIRPSSLFTALSSQLTDINLISIITPPLRIVTSDIKVKRVPVISRIAVEYERQYMQIGEISIDPDSIDVRSVEPLLDTLKGVYTESRHFYNVNRSLRGYVPLTPIENIVLPIENVSYSIEVDEYTELELSLPVEVINVPPDLIPITLPSEVTVKVNISRIRFSDNIENDIRLYVDYNDNLINIDKYFKIYTEECEGIFIKSMDPLYVELLFEKK